MNTRGLAQAGAEPRDSKRGVRDVESVRWRRLREWCEAVVREAGECQVPSAECREENAG